MVVDNVEEEDILIPVGGHGDAVDAGEGDLAFDLVLVLEVDELLHEGLDGVVVLEYVEDVEVCE